MAKAVLEEKPQLIMEDGRHLIFELAERSYGIPILKVNEIIGLVEITPIPKTPTFIKGIINLRGKIIPVMDLRLKFDIPEREYDSQTCIVIVNITFEKEEKQIGLVVDIVSEVYDIPLTEIEAPPKYGVQCDVEFLNGIGKVKNKVVMLLNIERALYSEDLMNYMSNK